MSIGPINRGVPLPRSPPVRSAGIQHHRVTVGASGGTKTFLQVWSEGQRPTGAAPVNPGGAARTPAVSENPTAHAQPPPNLKTLAERALDAEKKVDALLASATRGQTFSAGQLIALQATVFRYSQTVEVISRATDRLVGAIKQTLGTQV